MTVRERALEAMNRTNDILEAKACARTVEAKLVDVSALVFAFRAAKATPAGVPLTSGACHNLTSKAEAIGDPFDPKVLVTVLGDRLAVPVGAR
jgi:hypothetical protein